MAFRIFSSKIPGQVDLAMLINFIQCQIFYICDGFGVISQKQQFTPYVLFYSKQRARLFWSWDLSDTILKLDTLVMIQTKFGLNWPSSFRGEGL